MEAPPLKYFISHAHVGFGILDLKVKAKYLNRPAREESFAINIRNINRVNELQGDMSNPQMMSGFEIYHGGRWDRFWGFSYDDFMNVLRIAWKEVLEARDK